VLRDGFLRDGFRRGLNVYWRSVEVIAGEAIRFQSFMVCRAQNSGRFGDAELLVLVWRSSRSASEDWLVADADSIVVASFLAAPSARFLPSRRALLECGKEIWWTQWSKGSLLGLSPCLVAQLPGDCPRNPTLLVMCREDAGLVCEVGA